MSEHDSLFLESFCEFLRRLCDTTLSAMWRNSHTSPHCFKTPNWWRVTPGADAQYEAWKRRWHT